jgi:uncharacterized protein DUF6789
MNSIRRGLAAGLVATVVLSLVLLALQSLDLTPRLNLMVVLANALGYHSVAAGWCANFIVGVLLWGPLFAWLDRYTFFDHWMNGLLFASIIWAGVMLFVMPAAGQGLFGLNLGLEIPSVTLILHWIYGAALGAAYGVAQRPAVTRQVSNLSGRLSQLLHLRHASQH